MDVKRSLCLKDLPLFTTVSADAFRPVCMATEKRCLHRGEVLFHQGDPVGAVHLVKEGSFKLVHATEDGREVLLRIAGQGEVLGEEALFQDSNHVGSAVALEESKVCGISRQRLEEVIKQRPDLAWQVIASLGSRLYAVWAQLAETNGQTTREKVLSLLIRLSKEHGESCPQGTRIGLRLTHEDIAGMIGASRVMVTQVLRELTADNHLLRDGRHYVLKNHCF